MYVAMKTNPRSGETAIEYNRGWLYAEILLCVRE